MACCEGVRRKFPTNLIFLGIFTGAEGFMLGTLCAHFEADAILIAVGITVGVTLGLTLFAFQTKIDFTNCGGKEKIAKFAIFCVKSLMFLFVKCFRNVMRPIGCIDDRWNYLIIHWNEQVSSYQLFVYNFP